MFTTDNLETVLIGYIMENQILCKLCL